MTKTNRHHPCRSAPVLACALITVAGCAVTPGEDTPGVAIEPLPSTISPSGFQMKPGPFPLPPLRTCENVDEVLARTKATERWGAFVTAASPGGGTYIEWENGAIYDKGSGGCAYAVEGNFFQRWKRVGGTTGWLGLPKSAYKFYGRSSSLPVTRQMFEYGSILYKGDAEIPSIWGYGEYEYAAIRDEIFTKWFEQGGIADRDAFPAYDSLPVGDGVGWKGNFYKYQIIYSPATGAHVLRNTSAKYNLMGGATGYPTRDEATTGDGASQFTAFQNGWIYLNPSDKRAYYVANDIAAKWHSLGAEWGKVGYPTTDTIGLVRGGSYNGFERGNVYATPSTVASPGVYYVARDILNEYAKEGYEWGWLGYPLADHDFCVGFDPRWVQRFENGTMRVWRGGFHDVMPSVRCERTWIAPDAWSPEPFNLSCSWVRTQRGACANDRERSITDFFTCAEGGSTTTTRLEADASCHVSLPSGPRCAGVLEVCGDTHCCGGLECDMSVGRGVYGLCKRL